MPCTLLRRRCTRPSPRRRSPHWAVWALAPLALASRLAQSAAFAPGMPADPPTGAVTVPAADPEEPLRGTGIVWRLAPWRIGGTLAFDVRALQLDDGRHLTGRLMLGDVSFASYIWQPWFVQLRAGVGWVLTDDNGAGSGPQLSLAGRGSVSVFPASRFPFELRLEQTDSRADGVSLSGDYQSRRLSLTQSWRPDRGNHQLQLQLEHSRIDSTFAGDRLWLANASAHTQDGPHRLEFLAGLSDHRRTDSDEQTRLASLSARHAFQPTSSLQTDTLATWNEVRIAGDTLALLSDVRQISTFATWRPEPGTIFGSGHTTVSGSARWLQARSIGDGGGVRAEAVNTSAGLSHALAADWRLSASGSLSRLHSAVGDDTLFQAANGSLTWAPAGKPWGEWRHAPNAGANLGLARDSDTGSRRFGGLQAGHSLSRDWPIGDRSRLALSASQSVAWFDQSGSGVPTRALAHGASLGWQGSAMERGQAYLALSYSDSVSDGETSGRFQLVNLQLSQRVALTRYASWSANLTAQATRNRAGDVDPFTGERREQQSGWQRYSSGGASFEHARLFDVPRLRLALIANANSQRFERREFGDIDAPIERIGASFEARLDWSVGRLDTRLSLRAARVDDRDVAALQLRIQRRF